MTTLSHRKRVQRILRHEDADRVPRDLMGNATMLLDVSYLRLRDYLGLAPIEPFRRGTSANYYDERILDYFDIDFRRIFLQTRESYNTLIEHSDGTYSDIWSIVYRKEGIYTTAINHPLSGVEDPAEVEKFSWPVAEELFTTRGLRETAREKFLTTSHALVARNPFSAGFIDKACQLMGTDVFCMSLLLRPRVANSVLERIFEIYLKVYALFLDEVGEYVQMVETADDVGTQNSLLISPQHYREFVKPLERRFYQLIHEKAKKAALFRHTDGSVFPLIEDFIEIGIDVLNPVQTSSNGMGGAVLKRTFGDRITFHGAIETVAEPDEVLQADVKEKMATFKNGGGYIFAPCNHIIDVKPQSIIGLFRAADRYGSY